MPFFLFHFIMKMQMDDFQSQFLAAWLQPVGKLTRYYGISLLQFFILHGRDWWYVFMFASHREIPNVNDTKWKEANRKTVCLREKLSNGRKKERSRDATASQYIDDKSEITKYDYPSNWLSSLAQYTNRSEKLNEKLEVKAICVRQ